MASPLSEQTQGGYGSPPYHESSLKAALRLLASGIGYAGIGAAAAQPGAGFGNVLLGAGAGFKASSAAKEAAMAYAMKQQEAERQRETSELDREYKSALIDQLRKPPKPEKPKEPDPWDLTPEQQAKRLDYMRREKIATTIDKPEKPAKPDRTGIQDYNTISDNFRQDPDVKNYTVVRDNARRIEGALKQGTGFGDLSAIFAFMRVLDPESVVRETEFKNAEEAGGWLQRTLNIPGKVVSGNRLTPEARAKMKSMSNSLLSSQKGTYDRKSAQYRAITKKFGVDPATIIPDYGDDAGVADLIYNPATGQLEPGR